MEKQRPAGDRKKNELTRKKSQRTAVDCNPYCNTFSFTSKHVKLERKRSRNKQTRKKNVPEGFAPGCDSTVAASHLKNMRFVRARARGFSNGPENSISRAKWPAPLAAAKRDLCSLLFTSRPSTAAARGHIVVSPARAPSCY